MAVELMKAKPPFVQFEYRSVEQRDASLAAGHFVGKDIAYVKVTQRGSKDTYEAVADEWYAYLRQEMRAERFPEEWYDKLLKAYSNWKDGNGEIIEGTPLREWPPIRPSVLRTCIEIGLLSVEDLAGSNEEAVARIGLGGRQLRQMAIDWLKEAEGSAGTVARLNAIRQENEALKVRNESLEAQVKALAARVEALAAGMDNPVPSAVDSTREIKLDDIIDKSEPTKLKKLA